ncbi:MAG: M20 family peptidase [Rhizobiaceae bacterium]
MKVLLRLVLGLLALLVVLAAVLVFRTLTLQPTVRTGPTETLAASPPIDVDIAARHLSEVIRIKTISQQDEATTDRNEWRRLLDWVQQTYPKSAAAMQRELVADYTPIYTWPGSDASLKPIVLMAHQDVVPAEGNWKHPPFDGVIAEGAVWGRGSIDDKGSLVAIFEATEALLAAGFQPKRTVIIVNGHDEEVAQTGAAAAASALKARGVEAEFVLDEGLVTIADFPLLNGPAAMVGIAEKGYATLMVTAEGEGGHSSLPPPKTAVHLLAEAVVAIADNQDPYDLSGPGAQTLRGVAPYTSFVTKMAIANDWLFAPVLIGEITKTNGGAALLHTTTAPTMLEGSSKENVLPRTATAAINYRILPGQTGDDVMARAKSSVGDLPVTLDWIGKVKNPSPVSSTESDGWKVISALASQENTVPVTPALVLGATDAYQMTPIANDIYRFQPIVLTLEETKLVHGENEHLTLENLKRMIEFYARLIATSAG